MADVLSIEGYLDRASRQRRLASAVHPDLSPELVEVLAALWVAGEAHASQLTSTVQVAQRTLTRDLARLEELGLVRRVEGRNARWPPFALTAEGARRLEVLREGT